MTVANTSMTPSKFKRVMEVCTECLEDKYNITIGDEGLECGDKLE